MPFINRAAREIHCKLVYYGPGLGGKTTNVQYIHDRSRRERTGKLVSLTTDSERTLFFDFLPVWLGQVRGYRVRIHLYTVPGQIFLKAARALILRGLDGIVFVADSQPGRMYANIESVEDMRDNLANMGLSVDRVPFVLQCNKRDVPGVVPIDEMQRELAPGAPPAIPAVAVDGVGVAETFKLACQLTVRALERRAS